MEAYIDRFGREAVDTLTSKTARGWHLFYQHPGGHLPNTVGRLAPYTDTRADGGYVVAPPSLHPTGHRYTWLSDGSPAPLPRCLTEFLRKRSVSPASTRDPRSPSQGVPPSELSTRVAAYVAKVPRLAEGKGRNVTAFRLGYWLRNDMLLPDSEAWRWLTTWNRGNVPPLAERELQSCFQSASANAKRARGCGMASASSGQAYVPARRRCDR